MAKSKLPLRILWVPGLGADVRMFRDIAECLPDSIGQRQLLHEPFRLYNFRGQSLEEFTGYCNSRNSLSENYDLVIGCSMGGMIAQILIAESHIKTDRLFLLSSITSGRELTRFAYFGSFLSALVPSFLRKPLMKLIAYLYPVARYNVSSARWLAKMFRDFPPNVFFSSPSWIRKWKGSSLPESLHIYRVHGTSDPLLSYERTNRSLKIDQTVRKGSHILFATIPARIAGMIENFLTGQHMPGR